MARALVFIGAAIFIALGTTHGLLALRDISNPKAFTPIDPNVRQAMQGARLAFNPRANVWQAWLGFNISHSLGLLMFGVATAWRGWRIETVAVTGPLLAVAIVIGLIYFILSMRFWFYAPAVASAVGTTCFAVAWWLL